MLDIDERGEAAASLSLSNHRQRQCGFPGGFRTENFYHSASREPANAERAIN